MPTRRISRLVLGGLMAICTLSVVTAMSAERASPPETSRFIDPDDGWFDVSNFLDTAYGFVPVLAPITETRRVSGKGDALCQSAGDRGFHALRIRARARRSNHQMGVIRRRARRHSTLALE